MSALTIHLAPFLAPRAPRACPTGRPARRLVVLPVPTSVEPVPARQVPVHITRRGRLLLTALALLLVTLTCVMALRALAPTPGFSAEPVSAGYMTVMPGDTLWQIAGELSPSSDPRDVVASIVELNDLDSAAVFAGQRLAVPAVN